MFHRQTIAQFKQRLAVALEQLVDNRTSRRSGKRLEEITHGAK
jgi:hypothetical protein